MGASDECFCRPVGAAPWAYDHRRALSDRFRAAWLKYRDRLGLLCGACRGGDDRGPGRSLAFLLNYLRLLSGASVYRFISGALPDTVELPGLWDIDVFDVAALLVLAFALVGFVQLVRQRREPADICLAWGLAAMLAGFFVVAGPAGLQPHFERYGIVLVAPTVLVVSRGAGWWLSGEPRRRASMHLAVAACGWLLLATFWVNYFRCFQVTGGNSHLTFHTAAVEPKAKALKIIQAQSSADRATWVVADEWWLFWPLRYLAGRDTNLHVVGSGNLPAEVLNDEYGKDANLWCVQFVDGAEPAVSARLRQSGRVEDRQVICDRQGRPLISLVRLRPAPELGSTPKFSREFVKNLEFHDDADLTTVATDLGFLQRNDARASP